MSVNEIGWHEQIRCFTLPDIDDIIVIDIYITCLSGNRNVELNRYYGLH